MITHRRPVRSRYSLLQAETPPLLQFVVLSMLLHALLILLFGTATPGGARRGDDLLGALNVTLRQLSPELGSGFTIAPGADTDRPGAALLRRLEGAARTLTTSPTPEAAPTASPLEPASAPAATTTPPPAPAAPSESVPDVSPDFSISPRAVPAESLPKLDLSAPTEVDKPIVPPLVTPKPEREIAPPVAAPPREVMMPPMPPMEKMAPAKIDRQLAPPVELRQREAPVAPRAPAEPLPREEPRPVATPVEPIAPVRIEREMVTPAEVRPHEVPITPATPIERVVPQPVERQIIPPVPAPAPATPIERVVPQPVERQIVPPVQAPAPARIAPPIEREAAPVAQPARVAPPIDVPSGRERAAPAPVTQGKSPAAPARVEAPSAGEQPRLKLGAPNVEDEVFRSMHDEPAPETKSAPGLTAEALRRRAREIASEGSGSRGVLNLVPPPPPVEKKDTLAEGIAKAAKPDCRTAYAGLGLLAVAPLVGSTIGNGGCRW